MATIRNIKSSDFRKAGDMVKATITVSFRKLYPAALIKDFCRKYDPDNFKAKAKEIEMYVASENNQIVGIIGLKAKQLRIFYVRPDCQGRGIGRKLFTQIEAIAIKRGIKKLVL